MKETTILRLRKIFNKKMEKKPASNTDSDNADKQHPRGNNKGRNGQKAYPNAARVTHSHDSLSSPT